LFQETAVVLLLVKNVVYLITDKNECGSLIVTHFYQGPYIQLS